MSILSSTVFEIVKNAFFQNPQSEHKCFRIKGLQESEIVSLVQLWDMQHQSYGFEDVRLIVADSLEGKIPARYVAGANLSITYYRNHNKKGLIYLETRIQSDEQGLQNLFTLRDSNLLDGSFDEYAGSVKSTAALLLQKAWDADCKLLIDLPSILNEKVLLVLNSIHPEIEPIPVRKYIDFCTEIVATWRTHSTAITQEIADEIIGNCLWRLELFPDPRWNFNQNNLKTKRRLELNARHADLLVAGSEIDPDEFSKTIAKTIFLDLNSAPHSQNNLTHFRALCTEYVKFRTSSTLKQIPYYIFEQLFKKDTSGQKLGDKIRSEISSHDGRLDELIQANVIEGLNNRSQQDAERFFSLQCKENDPPLVDLLTPRTRRALDRLATPPAADFFNPAFEIARFFLPIKLQENEGTVAKIKVEIPDGADLNNPAINVLAFLFGPTLAGIGEYVSDISVAPNLEVCDRLLKPGKLLDIDIESEDGVSAYYWDPVPIVLTAESKDGDIRERVQLEWRPTNMSYFALFYLLATHDKTRLWDTVGELVVSEAPSDIDWVEPYVQGSLQIDIIKPAEPAFNCVNFPEFQELIKGRESFGSATADTGLSVEAINSYLDSWEAAIQGIGENYSPNGHTPVPLRNFLIADTISIKGSDRRLMIPSHPLRLRWVAAYLQKSATLAQSCLAGDASFANGDGEQYIRWLETLTPHENPPIALNNNQEILYPRTEISWFEDFAKLDTVSGDVGVDIQALYAICLKINAYLDAHPYKRDGLSLLIILPPSDEIPAHLIKNIVKLQPNGMRTLTTVAAPKHRWEAIAKLVELSIVEDRTTILGSLFPSHDLTFVEYKAGDNLPDALGDKKFDISIISHILQEKIVSQQNTEPTTNRPGRHNSLTDRPVRLDSAGENGAISIVLRPRDPDFLLEYWSTLTVRANRTRPVAPTQPENTDFVELLIDFQNSASIFNTLHYISHWVITLERNISREQIESVEAGAPDVLSVETDIGSNGLNTLIVSSSAGKQLITSRIEKKLYKLIPAFENSLTHSETAYQLAARIYDDTRELSPYLTLKAMGVSRVTEEILGLSIARHIASSLYPESPTNGICVWLSLDEHSDWLGGSGQVRADMTRILLQRSDHGRLRVDVLVLEGKLRQVYDPHGSTQVRSTQSFFREALSTKLDGKNSNLDSEMWRSKILAAIEGVSPRAAHAKWPDGSLLPTAGSLIPDDIRQSFRDGDYELSPVAGLYSACLWDSKELEISQETLDGGNIKIIRSHQKHILDLIQNKATVLSLASDDELPSTTNGSIGPSPLKVGEHGEIASVQAENDDSRFKSTQANATPSASCKKLDPTILSYFYNEILACFSAHNIGVEPVHEQDTPYVEGPASILFKLRVQPGLDPKKIFEKSQALKLQLKLEQEQSISFAIDKGFVTIDVPKRPEHRYFVNASDVWSRWIGNKDQLTVPFGEDRFGEIVHINFSSPNSPHLLVAGTTGSGKSEALNAILFGLTKHYPPTQLKLLLIDPKGTELTPFENSSYLHGRIGWDDSDALALLTEAVEEMQRRYSLFKEKGYRSISEFNKSAPSEDRIPWWLVVLDEYADLTSDPTAKKGIEAELKRLAQKARAAGIHVIIATQKPSADVISTNLRSNLPAQLALRVKSGTESRVIIDENGADSLNGKGDALFKADGKLIRVQCSKVSELDQIT